MSYNHTIALTVLVKISTDEKMRLDEIENIVHELDYEFNSDYGYVASHIEEVEILSHNRTY